MKHISKSPAPGDHILALCHMLSNRIGKAFASELGKCDVTVAEWRVILTLALYDRASGQDITNRWAMEKMAVNRAIAGLARRGLIEKKHNSEDRRNIDLALTAKGREFYNDLLPVANKRYRRLTAALDSAEKKELRKLLTKMILHFDVITD